MRIVSPDKFVNLIKQNLITNNNEIPFISYPKPTDGKFNIEFGEEIKNVLSVELFSVNGSKEKINDVLFESLNEKKIKNSTKYITFKSWSILNKNQSK